MRRGLGCVVALVAAACAGRDEVWPASWDDPFCADVMPRVRAHVEAARAEHPTPDDPRYGGTLVVGTIGEIEQGLMVLTTSDHTSAEHQQFVGLMTLVDHDEHLQPRPYLAESWEVNADVTEITFHLRRDVYWHDGEPTTARDVAFTYERVTDRRTPYPNQASWAHYVPGAEGVEVVDDHTVKVRLRPHSEFLDPWRSTAILPEHLLGDVPPEELASHPYGTRCPVGNGPFVFTEHRVDEQWTFVADPAFPRALGGRPFVDRYVYRYIPDQNTLLNELLAGGVDVVVAPRADQAQQIADAVGLHLLRAPFRDFVYVAWNARRPQLADPRVRRALTLATDRQEIVDALLLGYGRVANSTILPFHWAYDPEQRHALPYDPAAARALLDQAGWTDRDGDGVRENAAGVRLAVTILANQENQVRRRITEIMQIRLRDIGVDARPQVREFGALLEQVTDVERRDFDAVAMSWAGEFRIDDSGLFHSRNVDEDYAFSGTRNPELDRLMDTLAVVIDRDAARPLWREYERVLAEEQPYTFIYFAERLMGVNDRVNDMVVDPRGEWVNFKDWWLDPDARRGR